ncbi:hypothetical protein [uncultured Erythrobacter sp.]|uniref:hypothetical protein n=1 Tax=uncultured Erythrobacter sp. TaxID=263913 RepID=UPI00261652F8|nr:hypothetical protein [uncultured Erythrobacter sp.]
MTNDIPLKLPPEIQREVPYVVRCVTAMNDRRISEAKTLLDGFKDSKLPRHIAIAGRLQMLDKQYAAANELFEKAVRLILKKRSSQNNQYILHYCLAFLHADSNPEVSKNHAKSAASLKPPKALFLSIPIFDPDEPDTFPDYFESE